jgi:hypothetical protein
MTDNEPSDPGAAWMGTEHHADRPGTPAAEEGRIQDEAAKGGRSPNVQGGYERDGHQLDREHKTLTSEAAMPELPDLSLAWEDLSAVDRRALTEMLVDKIIIEWHPSKIDNDGKKH